ncbi:MAG: TraB/GumN family protein [Hyphomonadaceae bacterium]|nr:TraB/GumN family protein [Hyphomonadaceae bacterium]
MAMKPFAAGLVFLAALTLAACNDASVPVSEPAPEAPVSSPSTQTPDMSERVDLPPYGEPPVWSLSDEDTTVYLFGTVHILKPETAWQTQALLEALEGADAIYFEADVASEDATANMARLVPQLGMMPSGEKLSDLLDADELKEVEEAAALVGVPVAALDPMKPWLATVQMSVMALQKQGYSPDSGVETVLTDLAEAEGLELRFLESAEEQLRFFADLPMEDQVEFLVVSAQQIEDDPTMLDELVEEWAEGDVDDLAHLMAEPDVMGSEAVYDSLIVTRNANWTGQIKDLMAAEAGSFVIAVGAAHLAGEDSVIAMLRADGLEVEGP